MADQDGCPVCEGAQPMKWMFTHLSPPATVHSCEEHATINMITLLAMQLNVDMTWLYDVIANAVNGAADEHDNPPAPEPEVKPKPRKRASVKAETVEEMDDASV